MAERGIQPPSFDHKPRETRAESFECEFARLRFVVAPGVFEPNQLSAPLVDAVVALLAGYQEARVADVGTGCGAVAIAIATRCPAARVYALDISDAAVACAAGNAHRLGASNVEVLRGSLLEPLLQRQEEVDIIVSNAPWVAPAIVAVHELERPDGWRGPRSTVEGTDRDGLGLQRALLQQAREILAADGALVLEVDDWQVEKFAQECALNYDVTIAEPQLLILRPRGGEYTPAP